MEIGEHGSFANESINQKISGLSGSLKTVWIFLFLGSGHKVLIPRAGGELVGHEIIWGIFIGHEILFGNFIGHENVSTFNSKKIHITQF